MQIIISTISGQTKNNYRKGFMRHSSKLIVSNYGQISVNEQAKVLMATYRDEK